MICVPPIDVLNGMTERKDVHVECFAVKCKELPAIEDWQKGNLSRCGLRKEAQIYSKA